MLVSVSMNVQAQKPAASQDEMVQQLKEGGTIKSARVDSTMRAVDRQHYARLPEGTIRSPDAEALPSPYAHGPFPIGQLSTISSPYSHAIALEALEPHIRAGMSVLDVGSGSGYLAACFAQMVAHPPGSDRTGVGHVTALEHSAVLLEQSKRNIAADQEIDVAGLLTFAQGDALDPTTPWLQITNMQFDVVHAGVAYPTIPVHLLKLLKVGGHMLVPVGRPGQQKLMLYQKLRENSQKEGEGFHSTAIMACSYASVSMRAPPADVDHISSILREREKVRVKLQECRHALVEWQTAFAQKQSPPRKPSAGDMKSDPIAAALLQQVAPLVRQQTGYDRIIERYEKQHPTSGTNAALTSDSA
jgi:protein-L-isoaspartate(D-aspartate) O-methyltransferase